jgi:hypothetical protein
MEYQQRVNNTDGVEWKRCLYRILHFPFNLRLSINTLGNTLVVANERDKIKGMQMSYVCKVSIKVPRIKYI